MPKTIRFKLSASEITRAIKEVNAYRDSLQGKCELLCTELLNMGVSVASAKIGESPLGKYVAIRTTIKPKKNGCKAMLIATGSTKETDYGSVNTLLLIEFGAGIHYNSLANPKAGEFGMGVGTFPNQTHAFESGWYYPTEDGKWAWTQGTKATMPMYSADIEMLMNIRRVAKTVFGS